MPMKASDFYILSDWDGTLVLPDLTIPIRNIEAVNRFTERGGRFGIATGRPPRWLDVLTNVLNVNAPCIWNNGAIIHNHTTGETLKETFLSEKTKPYCGIILNSPLPSIVKVMTARGVLSIASTNDKTEPLMEFMNKHNYPYDNLIQWQSITEPWYKMVVMVLPEHHGEWLDYIAQQKMSGLSFTFSDRYMLEVLPDGVNKGSAIQYLIDNAGYRRDQIACIGDYYNDVEMLQAAGLTAAPASAQQEIKDIADILTGPFEDGAVADLIEYLENKYDY